jgi:hypothetical protein
MQSYTLPKPAFKYKPKDIEIQTDHSKDGHELRTGMIHDEERMM